MYISARAFKRIFRAVQRSALCTSRRELSNAYLLAKLRFDTAENEPCKVCRIPAVARDLAGLRTQARPLILATGRIRRPHWFAGNRFNSSFYTIMFESR